MNCAGSKKSKNLPHIYVRVALGNEWQNADKTQHILENSLLPSQTSTAGDGLPCVLCRGWVIVAGNLIKRGLEGNIFLWNSRFDQCLQHQGKVLFYVFLCHLMKWSFLCLFAEPSVPGSFLHQTQVLANPPRHNCPYQRRPMSSAHNTSTDIAQNKDAFYKMK